jgi:hypothetical protein
MGRHSRAIKAVCVTGAVVGMTLLGATATIAQEASVTVDISKDVFGTAPAGSTFEVTYTCEVPGNPDGNFSGTAQFDATGAALGSHGFTATPGTHCTITETVDGGASSVSYSCSDIPRADACTALGNVLDIGDFTGSAEVTVHNQFVPPTTTTTTPPPVTLQPVFTG